MLCAGNEDRSAENWQLGTELGFMTWVKICGITNLEDALIAVNAGADAVGFVFHEKSPRNIDPETAGEIAARLPVQLEKVGVFVNESFEHMESVAREVGLTTIQLHVEMPPLREKKRPEMRPTEKLKRYIVLPVRYFLDAEGRFDSFAMSVRENKTDEWVSAFFLDSGTPEIVGGTGRTFDWQAAVPVAEVIQQAGFSLVVAGGLTSTNVAEAIRVLKPWGVDVSSGVESKPGKKDPDKIQAFVAAVRKAERLV
jgi:phosphoribosylanthranilate isomerase